MNEKKLDWNDLKYFLHVAREQTLSGAARKMGVEHSTMGRRLSALEENLGAALVIRGPDGLQLTALGERIVPLVERVAHAVNAVSEQAAQQKVRVRLAIPTGIAPMFIKSLPQLRAGHPEIELELLSESRYVDLKKNEADIAIRVGPIEDEELVARKLCASGFALYASPSYLARHPEPLDLRDFAGHDVIFGAERGYMPAAQWMTERTEKANIVLRARDLADMYAATKSGAGLAVVPCILGDEDGELVRLSGVVDTREVSLVYRREVRMAEPVQAVISFAVNVINENLDRIRG